MVHIVTVLVVAFLSSGSTQAQAASALEGVWIGQDMVRLGQQVPASVVANIRFTFKGDKVTIRGNRGDTSEDVCPFTIDTSTSPKRIDIVNPNGVTMAGIYDLTGDVLKIALGPSDRRPTDFQSGAGSAAIVFTLKKGE